MNIETESKPGAARDKARLLSIVPATVPVTLGMVLVVAGLLVSSAHAATVVSEADKAFMLAAAQGGMTEVKLGELAVQNGARDDVKSFGKMMVKDHTAINNDLKALAMEKGVSLPASLDVKHQGMVDKMAALTGPAFDQVYVQDMVKDHKMDAREFKAVSAATKDLDIKNFVDKSIPIVGEHLKRITAMKK